jgi:HPt (histidine-containing phosphotransfer) domain-containing protein
MGMMDEQATRLMVRNLWLRNRPITLERFAVVRAAVDQLAAGTLSPATRETALNEAHKLRGILGTYGFAEASEVAGEAEDLLCQITDPGTASAIGDRLAACARNLADEG